MFDRVLLKTTGFAVARIASTDTLRGAQFLVPIEKCISGYGVSYAFLPPVHPYTLLLAEYQSNNQLSYAKSRFRILTESFRPTSLEEALFGSASGKSRHAARICFPSPYGDFTRLSVPLPWGSKSETMRYKHELGRRPKGWKPHALTLNGPKDFTRTIETYKSIKQFGYDPFRYSDGSLSHGFIQGMLLRDGVDERFVIMSGHHRVASLSALGWTEIPICLVASGLPVADSRNVEFWPAVREGLYDIDSALRIFSHFFGRLQSVETYHVRSTTS